MKAALLAILLGGCITIVQPTSSDDTVVGDDDGSGSDGGGGGDDGGGTGPGGCALATTAGPTGTLLAFDQAPDGTQWMLVGEGTDNVTTLWQRANGAWVQRLFDEECRYGVLAVDPQGRANVACQVESATVNDYDVRVYVVGQQSITSRVAVAATGFQQQTNGGRPSSIVVGANGRANVLWLATERGNVSLYSSYEISRDTGSAWQHTAFNFAAGDDLGHHWNDDGKLYLLGGELYFAVRMTSIMDVIVRDVDSGDEVFSASATDIRASDYAFDYEVAKSADGKIHFAYADASNVYSDVAPGLVNYYRRDGANPSTQIWVDGPPPIGAGAAGLGGISMALDATGTPFISYATKPTGALRIAKSAGAGWVTQDLAMGTLVGDSALRFDGDGHMHLAFEDIEHGTIAVLDEQCP